MKTALLILLASILLILGVWLTFFSVDRYGTHGDSATCEENKSHKIFYSATSYFLTTQSKQQSSLRVGACPYDNYTARTVALDVWVPALFLGFVAWRRIDGGRRKYGVK